MPELEQLVAMARDAETRGDFVEELRLWRQALDRGASPVRRVRDHQCRVQVLSARLTRGVPAHKPVASGPKKFGPLAPILLLLWKFKTSLLLALSKGKLLLFGLSKFSTFGSMLLAVCSRTTAHLRVAICARDCHVHLCS